MGEEKKKHRTTVTIYGQQYTIKSHESPQHVINVAEHLDRKMRQYKKDNPYLDTTRLAVLTALNTVDEYLKLKDKLALYEKEQRETTDNEE